MAFNTNIYFFRVLNYLHFVAASSEPILINKINPKTVNKSDQVDPNQLSLLENFQSVFTSPEQPGHQRESSTDQVPVPKGTGQRNLDDFD